MVAYDADDVVLVVDGVVRGRKRPPPLTPGAWLETWTPRGEYTSARTFRGIHVAWYGAHVARLRRMLASLAEAEPELFEGVPVPATDEATAAIVEETLKEALQECAMQGIKGPGDALGASVGGELAIVLAVSPLAPRAPPPQQADDLRVRTPAEHHEKHQGEGERYREPVRRCHDAVTIDETAVETAGGIVE